MRGSSQRKVTRRDVGIAGIAGIARDACIALRSGARLLLALRLACLACAALSVAGIGRTRTALRVAGISRTCATLRVASIARTCAALRIAGLTSGRAGMLTAVRVAGFAGCTMSDGARVALRPRARVVTRQSERQRGFGNLGLGTQLDVEVKLVRCCASIVFLQNALCCCYGSILLYEYPGAAQASKRRLIRCKLLRVDDIGLLNLDGFGHVQGEVEQPIALFGATA
jgi:hypothetical protein